MNKDKSVQDIIKEAEEAVASMKNEDLKKTAFEIVLSDLLKSRNEISDKHQPDRQEKQVPAKRKKAGTNRKNEGPKTKPTSLSFTTDQLSQLKEYFEEKKPTSEETCVFVLAAFIDEIIKQKTFHEGDVLYVYDQLLPLKPSIRPPALDGLKVARALMWLTARSRKKMWLQKNGENFEISAQGRLQIAYDSPKKGD